MQLPAKRFKSDLAKAQARAGYLFVLPSFALYAVLVLAPVIVTFILSFTYYDPMAGSRWRAKRISATRCFTAAMCGASGGSLA